MVNNIASLKERADDFVVNSQLADSRTAYAISLYSEISNISWNYRAPHGILAGCKCVLVSLIVFKVHLHIAIILGIGNDSKKELKLFELDTQTLNSFELANKLWDLIEESTISA